MLRYSEQIAPFACDIMALPRQPTILSRQTFAGRISPDLTLVVDQLDRLDQRAFVRQGDGAFESVWLSVGFERMGERMIRAGSVGHPALRKIEIDMPILPGARVDEPRTTIRVSGPDGGEPTIELQPVADCAQELRGLPDERQWYRIDTLQEAPDLGTWLVGVELLAYQPPRMGQFFAFYGPPHAIRQRAVTRYSRARNGKAIIVFEADGDMITVTFPPRCDRCPVPAVVQGVISNGNGTVPLISRSASLPTLPPELAFDCRFAAEWVDAEAFESKPWNPSDDRKAPSVPELPSGPMRPDEPEARQGPQREHRAAAGSPVTAR